MAYLDILNSKGKPNWQEIDITNTAAAALWAQLKETEEKLVVVLKGIVETKMKNRGLTIPPGYELAFSTRGKFGKGPSFGPVEKDGRSKSNTGKF